MNGKRAPGHFYCHVCPPQQGKGDDGLENVNRRRSAAYFQPGTGPPPSQKPEQWYQIPSWALKCIKSSCWNQIGFYSKPRVFCKGNTACFPYLNPTSPSLLPQNPTPNKWGKEEKGNGFPASWSIIFSLPAWQVPPFTTLQGPRTLPTPLKSIFSSSPAPFPTCLTLNSMKVHDWNYRLSTHEAWGGTS